MEPPTRQEIEQYRRDGTFKQRLTTAKEIGNHLTDPYLAQSAMRRLLFMIQPNVSQMVESGIDPQTPPPNWRGMPTKGNVKLLAVLIAFSDYAPNTSVSTIDSNLYGDGSGGYPYESLRNYYRRSSYNQLELSGTTLGWYTTTYPRSSVPQTDAGREALIKEALNSYHAAGHDFSQYDNDGDGTIDYFLVFWTGPDNGWANFWWGYQTSFSDSSFTLDGKRFGKYSWQWESRPYPGVFSPTTAIHETGHALGLPDLYDYDDTVGPRGGVGGLDMMDATSGDHNCFSKFLLDWITPIAYSGGINTVTLRASHTYPDAALFIKGISAGEMFNEFFMVQNRQRGQNDSNYPTDGMLIWHIDSRLNAFGTGFLYDNSYTNHKLVRLMEADGLEEIEQNRRANSGDYYTSGKTFGPATLPSSVKYDFLASWMGVRNISAAGTTMTCEFFEDPVDSTPPTGAPGTPTDDGIITTSDLLNFTWTVGTAADPESGLSYYLQVGTTPGGNDKFDGLIGPVLTKTITDCEHGRTYYARVRAMNGAGMYSAYSGNSDGITVSLPALACNSVDNCNLEFNTSGSAAWYEEGAVNYYGGTAAQSGDISNNQKSYFVTTLTGPGTLSFYWKVSSEAGYDFLEFYIDGIANGSRISGEVNWTNRTIIIPAGTHRVKWTYYKDAGVSSGSDAGWVDKIVYTSTSSTLTLNKNGTGTGTVVSSPSGINCGITCTVDFPSQTAVTLTATPDALMVFSGWTGAYTGMSNPITLTMDSAKQVTATFNQLPFYVTSPNGGEAWTIGSVQTISWVPNVDPGKVIIYISRDGGGTWTKLCKANSIRSFTWVVAGPATNSARIKITSKSNPGISDTSDSNFVIR